MGRRRVSLCRYAIAICSLLVRGDCVERLCFSEGRLPISIHAQVRQGFCNEKLPLHARIYSAEITLTVSCPIQDSREVVCDHFVSPIWNRMISEGGQLLVKPRFDITSGLPFQNGMITLHSPTRLRVKDFPPYTRAGTWLSCFTGKPSPP